MTDHSPIRLLFCRSWDLRWPGHTNHAASYVSLALGQYATLADIRIKRVSNVLKTRAVHTVCSWLTLRTKNAIILLTESNITRCAALKTSKSSANLNFMTVHYSKSAMMTLLFKRRSTDRPLLKFKRPKREYKTPSKSEKATNCRNFWSHFRRSRIYSPF